MKYSERKRGKVLRPSIGIPNGTEDIGVSEISDEVPLGVTEEVADKMDSIMGNNNWVLADLPSGCKPLGCKWMFKRKLKVDGTIEKFKARLVIQGFRQKLGMDYFHTYAPMACISTIRLLITLASIHNLIIHYKDVKTTFLNGELDKEQIDEFGKRVVICLYVDDMLIYGTDQAQVNTTNEFLSSRFSMKDMGKADVILVSTPMDTSEKLMPNNGETISQLVYSRVIGFLMYAMTYTRPDIAFVVSKLSRYTSNPSTHHWQAIQMVLKYLKKTTDYSLTYIGHPFVLEGYTNARWISNTEDNSSTSDCVFLLGGACGKDAESLRNLIIKIPLWSKPIAPISICCDSAATLANVCSQMYNEKFRNLGVRHNMICELIMNGVVQKKPEENIQNDPTLFVGRTVAAVCQLAGRSLWDRGLQDPFSWELLERLLEQLKKEGRQFQNQRNFAQGAGAAGNRGAENRAGNENQAQMNGEVIDEEELLFLAGEQTNTFDADVDKQPVPDLENNIDHMGEIHDEHEILNEVQQTSVVDSDSVNMGNSNIIPYEQYVMNNEGSVVPNNISYVRIDDSLAVELAVYKEQVAIYEQRAKFELTERE
nr:zinc finger, CCHC-type [Tanacetum cinerariifolium]